MQAAVYDTGALIAAEKGDVDMWRLHRVLVARGTVPVVPTPVLAEAWRQGRRQALLSRLLKRCRIVALTEQTAKSVGVLLGEAKFDDIVDAAVVVDALARQALVVTSNPTHIRQLASAANSKLDVVTV